MTATRYAVECSDYRTNPVRDRATAEHQLERIEEAGYCSLEHEIVEVSSGN